MKVKYLWHTKEVVVTMNKIEALQLSAWVFDQLKVGPDPDADAATRLEDAFREVLT